MLHVLKKNVLNLLAASHCATHDEMCKTPLECY